VLEGNALDATPTRFARSLHHFDRAQLSALTNSPGFAMTVWEKYFAGSSQTIRQTSCAGLLTAASFARTIAALAPWQQFGRGAAAPAKSFGEGGKWADRDGRASARSGFRLVFVVEG